MAQALLDLLALAASRYAGRRRVRPAAAAAGGQRFGTRRRPSSTRSATGWSKPASAGASTPSIAPQFGLPPSARHSFRDGLQRLFLGYALPSAIALPFDDRIAAGQPEGSAAAALGSFAQFFAQLERVQRQLAQPLTPDAWRDALLAHAGRLRRRPARSRSTSGARSSAASHGWRPRWTAAASAEAVPASVVRGALQALLDQPTMGGTPSGSVTFAAIASLRDLPYRVICVVGMRDGAFPLPEPAGSNST